MNKFETSDGERISQDIIKKRLKDAYQKHENGVKSCAGCGGEAQGHAHIVAQTRCKNLRHTEWIYEPWNWFKACHTCNSAWESYKGDLCQKLFNYKHLLGVLREHDYAQYLKYTHLKPV